MIRVDIIYFDAASGHRSAAEAIRATLLQHKANQSIQVRLVNLLDLLQEQPFLHRLAAAGVNFFNWNLRHEINLGTRYQVGAFKVIQQQVPFRHMQKVADFWRKDNVDVVISVMPICNQFMSKALRMARPECPYLVLPVDYEESNKRYWLDRAMDVYYLLPTPRLQYQAEACGIPSTKCIPIAGMPIDPSFYEDHLPEREGQFVNLGLDPALRTLLVSFGGQGSVFVRQCAEQLAQLGQNINIIFLCGRHQALFDKLKTMPTPYNKLVLSYTPEPPAKYYQMADIIIGKPGSMTLSEALVSGKPLVAIESKSLAIVQRGNERWIREKGVGKVIQLNQLAKTVRAVLEDQSHLQTIQAYRHRAVFDIAEIILKFGTAGVS